MMLKHSGVVVAVAAVLGAPLRALDDGLGGTRPTALPKPGLVLEVSASGNDSRLVRQGQQPAEFYQLANDVAEAKDLASEKPAAAQRLAETLAAWNKELVPPAFPGLSGRKAAKPGKKNRPPPCRSGPLRHRRGFGFGFGFAGAVWVGMHSDQADNLMQNPVISMIFNQIREILVALGVSPAFANGERMK